MNGKTLTAEQCSKLSLYILMTTKTREGEAAAWEKLAEEKNEDGSPKYVHAAVAEAVSGTMEERGRGFASDREAWAELKECIERTKQMHTDIEKVHKEMWSAVKDRNEDAFAALSQEFERSSRILAEEWAQTSALAKIAVISEEG